MCDKNIRIAPAYATFAMMISSGVLTGTCKKIVGGDELMCTRVETLAVSIWINGAWGAEMTLDSKDVLATASYTRIF